MIEFKEPVGQPLNAASSVIGPAITTAASIEKIAPLSAGCDLPGRATPKIKRAGREVAPNIAVVR